MAYLYLGEQMMRVKYRDLDVELMSRMMRAEAVDEGKLGVLYVGNVIVNRVKEIVWILKM